MKRILPVEELARDDRFERIRIEEVVFDPRNAAEEAQVQHARPELRELARTTPAA